METVFVLQYLFGKISFIFKKIFSKNMPNFSRHLLKLSYKIGKYPFRMFIRKYAKIYWSSPETLWNSATVFMLICMCIQKLRNPVYFTPCYPHLLCAWVELLAVCWHYCIFKTGFKPKISWLASSLIHLEVDVSSAPNRTIFCHV